MVSSKKIPGLGEVLGIAPRLRRAREALGLSQQELAERAGLQYASRIDKYEKGRIPKGEPLAALATALRVTGTYLLTGSDKKVEIVADPFEEWPEPKDPRRRLVKEIKKFALEADPEQDTKLINALLENVMAFREVLERKRKLKGGGYV